MNELDIIAPCGLNCLKCINNKNGKIKLHADELSRQLNGFSKYAERFAGFDEIFTNYPQFEAFLQFLTRVDCEGCRKNGCRFALCKVNECCKGKDIDFCYECEEFPCDKSGFPDELKKRWVGFNSRIKEIGLKAFIEETKDAPRYN
ncbi:MAG: hypothetical protein A2Y25_11945 [Candidatus Melainabacteria bacterium GWF2_37_15]|nr:MAG: hypothetical protein A2Y25_11945 [Candidatus Melainabacteria bacterium GWF2_37_15]